jgi:hypothetical protein
MEFKRVVWFVFFVLVSEIFLVSSMSSENYGILSPTVGDGGEKNLTSTNYGLGAIIGGISGLMNSATQVLRIGFWSAIGDRNAPTYSNAGHNSTILGESVLFSILWDDETSLHPDGAYIFSTNNSGTWVNDTAVSFSTTPSWANVTKTLTASSGASVGYRWHANDTAGNWNVTPIYSFVTNDNRAINVTRILPNLVGGNLNITKNEFFEVRLNVSCLSGNCGTVNVSLDPFLAGYSYRKELTIDNTKIDESLIDFPVMVKLNSSNFNFSRVRSDGYDIRFTSSDGETELKYEREFYNSTGESAVFWVKVPSVSSSTNTEIYMYYGDEDATDGQDAVSVWSNNFTAVWHKNDLTTSTIADSLGVNNGTKRSANEPIQIDGIIGKAQDYDGTNDFTNISSHSSLRPSSLTLSGWFYIKATSTPVRFLMTHSDVFNTKTGWNLKYGTGSHLIYWQLGNSTASVSATTTYSAGTWIYLTGTYEGENIILYKDGTNVGSNTLTNGVSYGSDPVLFGHNHGISNAWGNFYGDEVRISNVSRSAAWVKADYNSVNNSLLGFGGEEDVSGVKSGLIPVGSGNPFYTNASSNPLTTASLSAGQSEIVSFWVNATGDADNTHVFFAFVNLTANLSMGNMTDLWNVTILSDNSAPITPVSLVNSSDGTNRTLQNLNCYAMISDPDGDNLNVSVRWYKEGVLNLTRDFNNSYVNGTNFVATLVFGNTTKHQNWSCSVRVYDGKEFSGWGNSSQLRVLNSLPSVSLISPTDYNKTTNRTPEFTWGGTDDDGDTLTYEFNITDIMFSGTKDCTDKRLIDGLSSAIYVPTSDLRCLHDNGYYYKWRVRASDGEGYGSWSSEYTLNITASIILSMVNGEILLTSLTPLNPINDTDNNNPAPFVIENRGNAVTNISVNATQLWNTQPTASSYYQFKADNASGYSGAFRWVSSITSWFNFPFTGSVVAIDSLNYTANRNRAEIDIRVELPLNEDPGSKNSVITFMGGLAE